MRYADIEGLEKKDPFKKGIIELLKPTAKKLLKSRIRILPESLGEPAVLLDFLDNDFYLAFKTDGVGTKSLIADKMVEKYQKLKIKNKKHISKTKNFKKKLYSGLGIDLIASNVNDLICLGAKPLVLSDEVGAGNYKTFTDREKIKGLFKGFKKGCLEAEITIPCGESPTLTDIINPKAMSITGSSLGIIRPKSKAIFGQKLKVDDIIYGLASNGIHTNGLSLARKIAEKLSQGYFSRFGRKTLGEELLKPTRIYVKPVLEMLGKGIEIHYMTNISGSAFKKIMRHKKPFTYVIEKLPKKPMILEYLQRLDNIPDKEAYETWNMGLGFVIFAPQKEEEKLRKICQKYKIGFLKLGKVQKGPQQVIIKPLNICYQKGGK